MMPAQSMSLEREQNRIAALKARNAERVSRFLNHKQRTMGIDVEVSPTLRNRPSSWNTRAYISKQITKAGVSKQYICFYSPLNCEGARTAGSGEKGKDCNGEEVS